MDTTINEYLDYLQSQGKSAATLRATRSDLSGFQQWWEQTTNRSFQVTHLVSRDIRRWQQERQQIDGAKPSTINRGLSSLRGFCRWAMENGRYTYDPTEDIGEVTTPDLSPQGMSDAAIDALLRITAREPDSVQRHRDQAALALLVYAGLRIQETCHLQLRDLDLAGGMITIALTNRKEGDDERAALATRCSTANHSQAAETVGAGGRKAVASRSEANI